MLGQFAQTGPELGRIVRAGPVAFAPAGPFFGDFEGAVSLPAHYEWAGRVGALGHFPQAVPRHLERTVHARPALAHLCRLPKLGIA